MTTENFDDYVGREAIWRGRWVAHNHAPGSIGEQEADALLAAIDAMGAKA